MNMGRVDYGQLLHIIHCALILDRTSGGGRVRREETESRGSAGRWPATCLIEDRFDSRHGRPRGQTRLEHGVECGAVIPA